MSLAKRYRCLLGGSGLAVLLSACDFAGPRSALEPAGPVAAKQLGLFMTTFWWGMGVWVVVTALLIIAIVRFRARKGRRDELPEQTHGSAVLEVIWTTVPVIILIIIGVPTVRLIFETETYVPKGGDTLHVTVVGHQWWWEFNYPDEGIVTANELHVPVGTKIVLDLQSADVIHSFWVPRLAGKRDLIPNQDNQLWLEASEPGVYWGHCAELCLGPHAYMRFRVIAQEPAQYQAWVEAFHNADTRQVAAEPQVQEGQQLFRQVGCAGCHSIRGYAQGKIGPDLTNLGMRRTIGAGVLENTPKNLAAWIADPQAIKPGNYMPDLGLGDDQIQSLVAYLESLKPNAPQAQANAGGSYGTR
ncbi:MAG TPA: cytochrome c oxidase subunit II [Trueperaceae bacterium]